EGRHEFQVNSTKGKVSAKCRHLRACTLSFLLCVVSLAPISTAGQAGARSFGERDLQGIWTNATVTPLERPSELGGKEFFTEVEAATYEKQARARNDADRRDSDAEADLAVGYNDIFWERGRKIVSTRRTS